MKKVLLAVSLSLLVSFGLAGSGDTSTDSRTSWSGVLQVLTLETVHEVVSTDYVEIGDEGYWSDHLEQELELMEGASSETEPEAIQSAGDNAWSGSKKKG